MRRRKAFCIDVAAMCWAPGAGGAAAVPGAAEGLRAPLTSSRALTSQQARVLLKCRRSDHVIRIPNGFLFFPSCHQRQFATAKADPPPLWVEEELPDEATTSASGASWTKARRCKARRLPALAFLARSNTSRI